MTVGEGFVLGVFIQWVVFTIGLFAAFPWETTPGLNRAVSVLVSATATVPVLLFVAWASENVTVSWK